MDYLKRNKGKLAIITIYLVVMIIALFFSPVISSDEVIKYWSVNSILKGATLYKDVNVIVPYLSLIISYIAASIFHNIIILRILNMILFGLIFYFAHKIIAKYTDNHSLLFCANFICLLYLILKFSFYYDYNNLAFMFAIICLYVLLNNEFTYKTASVLAILCICTALCKHTVGFFYFVALFICLLIRNNIKVFEFWKKIICMLLIGIINVGIFIFYLVWSDSFDAFYDLAFCGFNNFMSNHIFSLKTAIIFLILFIIILISTIKKKIKWDKDDICILIFAIASLSIAFPIFDFIHAFPSFILLCVLLNKNYIIIKKDYFYSLIFCGFVLFSCTIFYMSTDSSLIRDTNDTSFKYLLIDKEVVNTSEYLDYVKNQYGSAYYIDKYAVFESVYLDTTNGYYDFLWNGNTGSCSSLDYVKKLEKDSNYIVILKDRPDYYQWDDTIFDYIMDNYELVEQNGNFLVYNTKK